MLITRANVEEYAITNGLEPVSRKDVIKGFAWKEPDLTIGGVTHKGRTLIFKPLEEWSKGITYERN